MLIIINSYSQSIGFDIIDKKAAAAFAEEDAKYDSVLHITKKQVLEGNHDAYMSMPFNPLFMSTEEILPYAILMANKYNHYQASYDIYYILWNLYPNPASLDDDTRNLAIHYLKKSIDLGRYYGENDLNKLQEAGYLDSYRSPFCD